MSAKSAEQKPRRWRGISGMVVAFILNIILMSVLVWFLLLIAFGCCRVMHSSIDIYAQLQTITSTNVNFLQQSQWFHRGKTRWQRWFLEMNKQITSNPQVNAMHGKLEETKQRFSDLPKRIQRVGQHWKREALNLTSSVTQIVVTRVLALCLSMPLFLLCTGLGFVDGVVQRAIRKYQNARESSFLFHAVKRSGTFWFYIPLFFYLALPLAVSPAWFLVPMAIACGIWMQLSTKAFKKYL